MRRSHKANPADTVADVSFAERLRRAAEAELCRRSLSEFVKRSWHIVEPGVPLIWNWHIDAICQHLEAVTRGEILRLVINIPPGHMKSLLASVFWPAWEWTLDPTLRSLFGSYDPNLALRDSMKCRDLIEDEWYRDLFSEEDDWHLRKDQNAKGYFANSKQGTRRAFAVGGKGKTGWRGDKIVVDDPQSADTQYNAAVKAHVRWVWDMVLATRVNDLKTAKFVIVMQRLADDDLSGHVLQRGTYEHLCLPSEFDPRRKSSTSIGWEDPRTEPGELLFPEKFPKDELESLKLWSLGPDGYEGQYQQSPIKEGGNKFKRDWFRKWTWESREERTIRLHGGDRSELVRLIDCRIFGTIDLANSTKQTADWTVISIWGVTRQSKIILLDRFRGRVEDPDVPPKARELFELWKASYYVVEANGMGLGLIQTMQRGYLGADGSLIGAMPVKGVQSTSDKLTRATMAIVASQTGRVHVPFEADWIEEWMTEVTLFPAAQNDDQVDAFSLAAIEVFESVVASLKDPEVVKAVPRKVYDSSESARVHIASATSERFIHNQRRYR